MADSAQVLPDDVDFWSLGCLQLKISGMSPSHAYADSVQRTRLQGTGAAWHSIPCICACCISRYRLKRTAPKCAAKRSTERRHTRRQVEIIRFIAEHGEMLARASTSGLHLADEMKARILNTFLTLMNLRENLDRAALRQPDRPHQDG